MSTIPGVSFGCNPLPIVQYLTTRGSAPPPILVWACERAGMFVWSPGVNQGAGGGLLL